MTYLLRRHVF